MWEVGAIIDPIRSDSTIIHERPNALNERPRIDSGGVRVLPHPRQRPTAALLLRVPEPEVLQRGMPEGGVGGGGVAKRALLQNRREGVRVDGRHAYARMRLRVGPLAVAVAVVGLLAR